MSIIEDAKKRIKREEFLEVAEQENLRLNTIFDEVSSGRMVIPPKTKYTKKICGIGSETTPKIAIRIGSNMNSYDDAFEIEKAKLAVRYGADLIINNNTGPDIPNFNKKLRETIDVPIGTVPIFEIVQKVRQRDGDLYSTDEEDYINAIESQLKSGSDFLLSYASITQSALKSLNLSQQVMKLRSHAGAYVIANMLKRNNESLEHENFEYVLELLHEHDTILLLASSLHSSALVDSNNVAMMDELIEMGRLVKKAKAANVQVIAESQKHVHLPTIKPMMHEREAICGKIPFVILGPIVTDISPGYDNINAAIGATAAASSSADILFAFPSTLEIGNPGFEETRQGIIAAKIAAHISQLYKNKPQAWEKEKQMAQAKANNDWEKQYELSLDSRNARLMKEYSPHNITKKCDLCGDNCAIERAQKRLKN